MASNLCGLKISTCFEIKVKKNVFNEKLPTHLRMFGAKIRETEETNFLRRYYSY